jgi:hypothetical protein
MRESDLQLVTLAGVRHRCAQESDRFFERLPHDPRYCYELFRRAIALGNQRAWDLIYAQYEPLVTGWVRRHAMFSATGEEARYFVNAAFEKLWARVTPENFASFSDLKSILRYLQMCVNSAIVDFVRATEAAARRKEVEQADYIRHAGARQQEEFTRLERQELWGWLSKQLKNSKEESVVYGTYVLDMKPHELYERYGDLFEDVKEIYRVKENLLVRLRRHQSAGEFFVDP